MAGRHGSRLAFLGIAAAALYFLQDAFAAAAYVYPDGSSEVPVDGSTDPTVTYDTTDGQDGTDVNDNAAQAPDPVSAFLYMLRCCEHNALDVASGRCYNVVFGGGTFSDMSDHPYETGEWKGKTLPPATCVAAGIPSGICKSTAAGAYQITYPTWRDLKARLGLTDFSQASQDAAAAELLRQTGAIDALSSGDVAGAIADAGKKWASLPGAIGGQGQRTLAFALNAYNTAATA